jgi:transmembrane sensor
LIFQKHIFMTKELFTKYLQGKCTESEFEQLRTWIKEDSFKSSEIEMANEVWDEFEPETGSHDHIRYSELLDRIHNQININQNIHQLTIRRAEKRKRLLTIITRAAAILFLPLLSLFFYTHFSNTDIKVNHMSDLEVEAPAGSRIHIKLSDGTKVWLNHGSMLKYPYRFKGKSRDVYLTGEAYFEVAHNDKVPFNVTTDRLMVKAIGTTFNVSAYSDDDVVETTLIDGKVIVIEKNNTDKSIELSPGEWLKFDFNKNEYSLTKGSTEKHTAWKDGLLVFKNDGLDVIAKKIARWYDIDVEITNEKVKEITLTATFIDESLPQVLEMMALATQASCKLTTRKKLPDGSFSKQKVIIE